MADTHKFEASADDPKKCTHCGTGKDSTKHRARKPKSDGGQPKTDLGKRAKKVVDRLDESLEQTNAQAEAMANNMTSDELAAARDASPTLNHLVNEVNKSVVSSGENNACLTEGTEVGSASSSVFDNSGNTAAPNKESIVAQISLQKKGVEKSGNIRYGRDGVRASVYFNKNMFKDGVVPENITITVDGDADPFTAPGEVKAGRTAKALTPEQIEAEKAKVAKAQERAKKAQERADKAAARLAKASGTAAAPAATEGTAAAAPSQASSEQQ